jgi:hypothetical protein
MVHFGLGPTRHQADGRHLAERPRADLREPGRRPALHGHRAPRPIRSAPPPVRPGPVRGGEPAARPRLEVARGGGVDETYLQRLIPVRLNRRGPASRSATSSAAGRDDVVVGGTTLDPLRILRAPPASGPFIPGRRRAVRRDRAAADDGPLLLFDAAGTGQGGPPRDQGRQHPPRRRPGVPAEALPQRRPRRPSGRRPTTRCRRCRSTRAPSRRRTSTTAAASGSSSAGRVLPGQYPLAPRSALLANRGGRFEDVTDSLAPGSAQGRHGDLGPVERRRRRRLARPAAHPRVGQREVFPQQQGKGFEDWTPKAGFAAAGTGWWTSIAAADFNGDGRPDYVVGNVGLNTQYHADPARPALLFSGDFRGNGSSELIEAYYEGDKLYPWRSRKGLAAAIPSILKRFSGTTTTRGPRSRDPRRGSWRRRRDFAATELRAACSSASRTAPTVRAAAPDRADLPAPGHGAGDFWATATPDIYAVQNSYAPIRSDGRFDGGLGQLLRGDGRGHFTPVPRRRAAWWCPATPRRSPSRPRTATAGRASRHAEQRDSMLAFRNNGGVAGHRSLGVRSGAPREPDRRSAPASRWNWPTARRRRPRSMPAPATTASPPRVLLRLPETANPPRKVTVRWPRGGSLRARRPPPGPRRAS